MTVARQVERPPVWPEFAHACILLVDDDADATHLMARALGNAGCKDIVVAETPTEALDAYRLRRPDLVVMDLRLPGSDGLKLMESMHEGEGTSPATPVLMVTGDTSERVKRQALERGVADFLAKNADTTELVLRIRNLLRLNGLRRRMDTYLESLEEMVRERTRELGDARHEVLERLAIAAEYRNGATLNHTRRVGRLSARLATQLGLSPEYAVTIQDAALLHDLGKIGIPDAILLKPDKLTPAEFERVKEHPEIGAHILDGCHEPLMRMARDIALTHHERWDGNGYPRKLARTRIPLCGRIVAVADAFDVITHERPYKPARPIPSAVAAIKDECGKQFDPSVVGALLALDDVAAACPD
jgi:putative two-component system response regulator